MCLSIFLGHIILVMLEVQYMNLIKISDKLSKLLQERIIDVPEGFYDTFKYTKTGNNLTHPITWGILAESLLGIPGIKRVGLDVRLNLGNKFKFQPDLIGYNSNFESVVFVDYESPNSSDARIPIKDVDSYRKWSRKSKKTAPYIIITTLPDHIAPDWELRYASKNKYNEAFFGMKKRIQKNPCHFWYSHYLKEIGKRKIKDGSIAMINISGKKVTRLYPRKA